MIELNKDIKLTNEQIKLSLNKIIDYLKKVANPANFIGRNIF